MAESRSNAEVDENQSICVICCEPIDEKSVGKLNSCNHRFCFACITQWYRSHKRTCPLDRIVFSYIELYENGVLRPNPFDETNIQQTLLDIISTTRDISGLLELMQFYNSTSQNELLRTAFRNRFTRYNPTSPRYNPNFPAYNPASFFSIEVPHLYNSDSSEMETITYRSPVTLADFEGLDTLNESFDLYRDLDDMDDLDLDDMDTPSPYELVSSPYSPESPPYHSNSPSYSPASPTISPISSPNRNTSSSDNTNVNDNLYDLWNTPHIVSLSPTDPNSPFYNPNFPTYSQDSHHGSIPPSQTNNPTPYLTPRNFDSLRNVESYRNPPFLSDQSNDPRLTVRNSNVTPDEITLPRGNPWSPPNGPSSTTRLNLQIYLRNKQWAPLGFYFFTLFFVICINAGSWFAENHNTSPEVCLSRLKETVAPSECDRTPEAIRIYNDYYPFATVLRLRVLQIVCGISFLIVGTVAFIEERGELNLSLGIPAGGTTILAAAASIHTTKGFGGYRASTCLPDSPFRFLGPTIRIAVPVAILWGSTCSFVAAVIIQCVRTIAGVQEYDSYEEFITEDLTDIAILAGVELILSLITLLSIILLLRIDCKFDPD